MKKLLIIVAVLAALAVAGYFVGTSSGFLKSVVLPRVGAKLNAKIDAESIALRPFSSIEIHKLSVVPNGKEPLASVAHARVRYRLGSILKGNIVIDEILVDEPAITVVQAANGTSNLDPILKAMEDSAADQKAPKSKPADSKPLQLDLKSLKIQNAQVRYQAAKPDGSQLDIGISALTATAQDLRNGGKGRIEFGSNLALDQRGAAGAAPGAAQGRAQGAFDLTLTQDLLPASLNGRAEAQLAETSGPFADLSGLKFALTTDLTPTTLNRAALEFERQGTALGSVTASGPLDMARKEAQLRVDIAAIDRNVLNLVGAASGLDFTTTRFDSTNQIVVAAGGQKLGIQGSLAGSNVAIKKGALTMPPVDVRNAYDIEVDTAASAATVRAFTLNGTQRGREVVRGTLSKPMLVNWGANAGTVPDATIDLVVSQLQLADWSALAGTPIQGTFTARAGVGVQGGGKDLAFDATASLAGLSGSFASNQVQNLGLTAIVKAAIASFADVAQRKLVGSFKIENLSGKAAVMEFSGYGLDATTDLGLPENAVVINDLQVRLRQGNQDGGAATLKGRWDTAQSVGKLNFTATGVNQAALRPFLQASLGERQLRSILVTGDAGFELDGSGKSSVQARASVTNLVVHDPAGTVPQTPLAAGLTLDAGGANNKIDIRQAELRLTPTTRAGNALNLTGQLDFSKAEALRGALKLASDSLDVTPYFDLFYDAPKTNAPAPATPPPSPGGPQVEPEPIKLPIELLTFDATIGKFYLREVTAENLRTSVRIAEGRVDVDPLELSLNGAPVKGSAKLNLGVPGYEYDLKFAASSIPVKPFADSFVAMLKNKIEGTANAQLDVKGTGVTGVNLQKSLVGGMQFSVTNANLRVADMQSKKGILSVLTGLLASALNIRELKDQPIMDISARVGLGGGKIDITEATFRSASLRAGSTGSIPIANDLMQSPLSLPVDVALFRNLAERAKLVTAETPTNATYVPIPAIASVKGTLGAPEPTIDKVQAGLLGARAIGGIVGGKAGDTVGGVADLVGNVAKGGTNAVGNLIQGLGGLLNRNRGSTPTNTAPTNRPPTP